ncbi:right-handed parallel beta-helix repeat-containing protein [Halomicroarcula sp. S1AR25-4]|uniref:right-handed parallel beta-helix repeat-containing protein n=1 Tax=Haloarcula sp. S1AR25-4 TaxID=2950538 RepID=UPI0028750FB9|nr:right-handed parallel beta-helix repeat-containing protein [Halomicroarcula sp. S1AR25-4]MDS0277643.1 right-handed parallel beta-helix repeat-containing protein [Halomicroarcula sp. S1AR25-4]
MKLRTPVLLAILVLAPVAATPVVDAQTQASGPTAITECRTITDPGRYVLTRNLSREELTDEPCLRVRASDVVLDGQGHTIEVPRLATPVSVGAEDRRLSNVTVRNLSADSYYETSAITVDGVDGVTVRNVTLSDNRVGLSVTDSTSVRIESNGFYGAGGFGATTTPSSYGVTLANTTDAVVTDNRFGRFTRGTALNVDDGARNTTVANNSIRGCVECDESFEFEWNASLQDAGTGVEIARATGTAVVNNSVSYHTDGVVVDGDSSDTEIRQNRITHTKQGVLVATTGPTGTDDTDRQTLVANNTLRENAVGLEATATHVPLVIRHNDVAGNDLGLYLPESRVCAPGIVGTERIDVSRNAIVNSTLWAVNNERSATLNATANYWGAASGPSSANDTDAPFADPETGTLADGQGGAVSESPTTAGESNVRFDPWLNESVAEAGVP